MVGLGGGEFLGKFKKNFLGGVQGGGGVGLGGVGLVSGGFGLGGSGGGVGGKGSDWGVRVDVIEELKFLEKFKKKFEGGGGSGWSGWGGGGRSG